MRRIYRSVICQVMLAMVMAISLPGWASAAATPVAIEVVDSLPLLPEDADLKQLSQQLELIRQSVPISTSDEKLAEFRQGALQVQQQAETLLTVRATEMERLDDQLDVVAAGEEEVAGEVGRRDHSANPARAVELVGPGDVEAEAAVLEHTELAGEEA